MTDKWQTIDTHGAGPPVQVPVLCRETVEACAKIVDAAMKSKDLGARSPKLIASAIRSLTAGREIQSSDGGAKVASSAVLASEEDQRSGLHGVMPVGTIAASSGNTDAGPSEAIHAHQPSMPKYEYQKDAGEGGSVSYRDPVVRQDCAPAGTVSAMNSQYAGLEALLAAIHADDPKRELLVRVGDLMRENRALLSQFDVRRK